MSALPKPTAQMSMRPLRLVEVGEAPTPRRIAGAAVDAELLAELRELRRETRELSERLRGSETKLRDTQKKLRGLQRASRDATTPRIEFADAEEWVRYHVRLAWFEQHSPLDRAAHPLNEFLVGPDFADTVRRLAPQLQSKVWRAAVDVVTGRGRHLHSREAHPLRSGTGAHAHDVVRVGDDARCFRYSVGFKAAGARRLHAWHLPDGTVELSRVVAHGDMSP